MNNINTLHFDYNIYSIKLINVLGVWVVREVVLLGQIFGKLDLVREAFEKNQLAQRVFSKGGVGSRPNQIANPKVLR